MKFEKNDLKIIAIAIVILIVGAGGYLAGASQQPIEFDCLTTQDLNRTDIGAGVVLSRFCEGMGLHSSIYWQQDEQGQKYGLPICIPQNEG